MGPTTMRLGLVFLNLEGEAKGAQPFRLLMKIFLTSATSSQPPARRTASGPASTRADEAALVRKQEAVRTKSTFERCAEIPY